MKINSSTSQGSHFHKTGMSLWWGVFPNINVSSRFAGTFLFMKSMGDIFKDSRQAFGEKRNKNRSQMNELVEHNILKNSS